jgi:hypothetical protein
MSVKRLFRIKLQSGTRDMVVFITDTQVIVEVWEHGSAPEVPYGPFASADYNTLTAALANSPPTFNEIYGGGMYRSVLAAKIDELEQSLYLPDADVETIQTDITRLTEVYNS